MTENYQVIANKIFKRKDIGRAVYDVIYNGHTIYRAEVINNIPANTLSRYVTRFKAERKYLKKLGVVV